MLKITFIPDGTTTSNLVLVNTSRSISELDVRLNHRRVISVQDLVPTTGTINAALAQDLGNHRNTLSLKVRRSVDLTATPVAFADPEAALLFALDQSALFVGTGFLKIELTGATTSATRFLLNCAVEAIELTDWLGVGPAFQYNFNGGLFSTTSP